MKIQDLANKLNFSESYLHEIANHADKFYYTYYIEKKNGKERQIDSPSIEIKGIQRWIKDEILEKVILPNCIHGFRKNHSVRTNAMPHLGRTYVYCIDIKDFFPTIKYKDVFVLFQELGNDIQMAAFFSSLCTYNGYLPQGAVTSPTIANIIFSKIDSKINEICSTRRISYTRYADDLTFSSNSKINLLEAIEEIKNSIEETNFKINLKKSRLMSGQKATIVTGLRLNSKKLSIGNWRKKLLRAKIFKMIMNSDEKGENKILGELAYLRSIEPDTYKNFKKYVAKLITKKNERKLTNASTL